MAFIASDFLFFSEEPVSIRSKHPSIPNCFNVISQLLIPFPVIRTTITSVSYTHLDVYKRQIHVSPSEKELRAMGNSEQEQAEAMKHKDLINCSITIANK